MRDIHHEFIQSEILDCTSEVGVRAVHVHSTHLVFRHDYGMPSYLQMSSAALTSSLFSIFQDEYDIDGLQDEYI
jgi:hypothetical protein